MSTSGILDEHGDCCEPSAKCSNYLADSYNWGLQLKSICHFKYRLHSTKFKKIERSACLAAKCKGWSPLSFLSSTGQSIFKTKSVISSLPGVCQKYYDLIDKGVSLWHEQITSLCATMDSRQFMIVSDSCVHDIIAKELIIPCHIRCQILRMQKQFTLRTISNHAMIPGSA